jgi:hypothetical protein
MRQVDVYIEVIANSGNYEKLELFNDEEIQINSSIQNVQDLAKVYTDFTQSFTIPASPRNNRLFEHFYQSDVNANDNPNIKRNGFIEIGTIPFRSGKISIESSNVVKGRVESYSITFYGDLTSLKDKFGDKTLKDLDLRSYGMNYSGSNVRGRIINTVSNDLEFPLITSKRHWTYGLGTSTCIDTTAGAIVYNELFPALKVKRIFEAIQTDFGVTFNSNFFNQKLFTELFLWLKNAKDFLAYSESEDVTFSSITGTNNILQDPTKVNINLTQNITITAIFTSATTGIRLFVDAIQDGKLVKTTEIKTGSSENVFSNTAAFTAYAVKFRLRASTAGTATVIFGFKYKYYQSTWNGGFEFSPYVTNTASSGAVTFTSPYVDPSVYAPNMKISDFVSGVFKMFNLTCYATSVDNFQVEPLDDWYSKGAVVDITEYIDTDEITIERHKLYKEISFDYEKSESYLNEKYFNETTNATREFGNVKESFANYDGGDYKVDLPFENIYFTKEITSTVNEPPKAYLLNEDTATESYDNKPILLYLDSYQSTSFYFDDGSSDVLITAYRPLCNQITYNNVIYSNHFSTEPSAFNGVTINNSLYSQYYAGYLQNLYNPKNRLTNVKALFPISLLTSLKLNDRLIIRDKRYVINEMKVNLTSGEVDLSLINDFRAVANVNIPVQSAAQNTVEVPFFNQKPNDLFEYDEYDPGTSTINSTTYASLIDSLQNIIIAPNTSGVPVQWPITRNGEPYLTIYQDA